MVELFDHNSVQYNYIKIYEFLRQFSRRDDIINYIILLIIDINLWHRTTVIIINVSDKTGYSLIESEASNLLSY